jgi:hypothetical protein
VEEGRRAGARFGERPPLRHPGPPNQPPPLRPTPPNSPDQLDALWPNGTCAKLGLAGKANVTLERLVTAMVTESNTPAAAKLLNAQLRGVLASAGAAGGLGGGDGGGLGGGVSLITEMQLNCTDLEAAWEPGAAELGRKLYCGYYQARCGGGGAQQLAGAYDWRGTSADT